MLFGGLKDTHASCNALLHVHSTPTCSMCMVVPVSGFALHTCCMHIAQRNATRTGWLEHAVDGTFVCKEQHSQRHAEFWIGIHIARKHLCMSAICIGCQHMSPCLCCLRVECAMHSISRGDTDRSAALPTTCKKHGGLLLLPWFAAALICCTSYFYLTFWCWAVWRYLINSLDSLCIWFVQKRDRCNDFQQV